jgi:parallel beta-helix repeat protein
LATGINGELTLRKKLVALWLCAILAATTFVISADVSNDAEGKIVAKEGISYITSAPFRINSNADFAISPKVSGGDGTQANPWIIENYEIDGTGYGYCIFIGNTTDYFEVRDCYLHDASGNWHMPYYLESGLSLYMVTNGTIINNTASDNWYCGINLHSSSGNTISSNTANSNFNCGFYLYNYSNGNIIRNNTANMNQLDGIGLYKYCSGNTIINNTANSNTNRGICLSSSNFNSITNNTASLNNFVGGISLVSSSGNTLTNNTVTSNVDYGISLLHCNGNNISNNIANLNQLYGIYILNSDNNTIDNNTAINSECGIFLDFSSNNRIVNNTVSNERVGIQLNSCNNNTLANNIVYSNNYYGIYLTNSTNNWISSCTITNNTIGINTLMANHTYIYCNNISNNKAGLVLTSSSNNTIVGNTISNSTGITGGTSFNSLETGLPVYQNDKDWTNYTTFWDQLTNGAGGKPLFTRAVSVSGGLSFNVHVWGANDAQDLDLGIYLDGKDGNPIDNTPQQGEGFAYSAGSTADECVTLMGPQSGTYLIRVFGFTVSGNPGHFNMSITLLGAPSTGIYLWNLSNDNTIYHNNFISNANQAYDSSDTNAWNIGYPSGGNYWSDFTEIDIMHGVNQDILGRDGIGDTPYANILGGGGAQDRYPLCYHSLRLPIRINNNAEFTPQNGVSAGDGTQANPWVIENYDINGTGYGYCIYIGNTTDYFVVRNCYLHGASGGATPSYYVDAGLTFYDVENGIITNSTFVNNDVYGVEIVFSANVTLSTSTSSNNTFGVNIEQSQNISIANNELENNFHGVYISSSNNNTVENNNIVSAVNNSVGISIIVSDKNLVSNNTVQTKEWGIFITNSDYTDIFKNNIDRCGAGCYIMDSAEIRIQENRITNGTWGGIYAHSLVNASVDSDTIYDTLGYGIFIENCIGFTVINTTSSNKFGGVRVTNSREVTISKSTITNNFGGGIYVQSATNLALFDNNIDFNDFTSVYVDGADNLTMSGNTISGSTNGAGMYAQYVNDSVIDNNLFSDNKHDNLFLVYALRNTVKNNTFTNAGTAGIDIMRSENNKIYHNNIINNAIQSFELDSTNIWDNGYPSGGNYWSDYAGLDRFSGPTQIGTGSDGIGDTPYLGITSNSGSKDRYPLMKISTSGTLPMSDVGYLANYWYRSQSVNISASALDTVDGFVSNVTLLYSYSSDNATWSPAVPYGVIFAEPWNWTFDFPAGEGYYKFYSVANDSAGNMEALSPYPDARCGFDATAPEIIDNSIAIATTGDAYTFRTKATDSVVLSEVRAIYWFGNDSEINATVQHTGADNYNLTMLMPANITGIMHYRIAAVDKAGNWNASTVKHVTISDNDAPIANPGPNQTVGVGTTIKFDGSGSTDNIGILNYTWAFHDGNVVLYGISPSHNFTVAGNYTVALTVLDSAGNGGTATIAVNVTPAPPIDTDGDGLPDSIDPDDDNDGYLDEWETFLGTDPLDANDKPLDTDGDGKPDGDATNSQPWMDTDDDGDGVPDDEEMLPPVEESNFIGDYWWLLLLVAMLTVLGLIIIMRRKPEPAEPPDAQQPTPETELCPKCGFDIEKGAPCPFCVPEKQPEPAPEPPKKLEPAPPKTGLNNQEMLQRIEKAYKEGKMTEAQYLKNKEKFQ